MSVLPFRTPNSLARFAMRVQLGKGERVCLYEIRLLEPMLAQAWVRLDRQPHRAELLRSVHRAEAVAGEFAREIGRLEADGWCRM